MGAVRNHYADDLAILLPDGRGGWRRPEQRRLLSDGTMVISNSTMSEHGRQYLLIARDVIERHREALEAITPHLGLCPHGRPIPELVEQGELEWTINDYICDIVGDPEGAIIELWGAHQDAPEGDVDAFWCFTHSYLRGVVTPHGEASWQRPLVDWRGDQVASYLAFRAARHMGVHP